MKLSRLTRYAVLATVALIILIVLAAFMGLSFKQDNIVKNYGHLSAQTYDQIESELISNRTRMFVLAIAIITIFGFTFYLLIWKQCKKLGEMTEALEYSKAGLSAERDKLDDIVSAIDADLLLLDREMKIIWVNRKLKERDSYLYVEMVGQACNKAYCNVDELPEDCPAVVAFDKGIPVRQEHAITHPDGTTRIYQFTCSPIRDKDGTVVQVLELVQDVTSQAAISKEVKQKNRELEAKTAELERMNKLFIGRELRMAELKERIAVLEGDKIA